MTTNKRTAKHKGLGSSSNDLYLFIVGIGRRGKKWLRTEYMMYRNKGGNGSGIYSTAYSKKLTSATSDGFNEKVTEMESNMARYSPLA